MKASWQIARVQGIAIRIHATFPLLLVWVGLVRFLERRAWNDAVTGIAFALALFVFVTLHELGHALVAKRLGIRTRDITLLPIGGVARLERLPTRPRDELLIALAGPAVNAVLAFGLFAGLAVVGVSAGFETSLLEKNVFARLAWVNIGLAVFNLLPAFPMDGGRVLRAVLAMRTDYIRATNVAASVGQGFAVVLGLLGLMSNPFLAVIAVFVWVGAEEEARATRLRQALAGVPVDHVMMTDFRVLAPDDPLQRAVDFALAGRQQHFPVVREGALAGVLRWEDLLTGLAQAGATGRVGDHMRRQVGMAHRTDNVEGILDRAREDDARVVPVLENGRLVGLFSAENLAESVILQDAMDRGARRVTPSPG